MTTDLGPLAGRSAIVTGASRGIGEAIVHAYLRAGASRVVAIARSADRLEALAEADERIVPITADLGVVSDVDMAFATAEEVLGRIDVLVNNAAMGWTRRSTKLDAAQLDDLYAVNVRSTTLLSIATAAHMAAAGGGSIINISLITATRGAPFLSAYAATKGAIDALTRSLAAEWGSQGVRVNTLSPGVIDTEIWSGGGEDPTLRTFIEHQIPLGRWGEADDVAEPAVFLASDASRYITGETMTVDGGMTARVDLAVR